MYKIKQTKTGLNLITVPMSGTKTATVLVMVGTGSKYENKKNSGISHFLEHMFFKGAKKWNDTLAISSELDGIGAEFNAFTGAEYTGYWIKAEGSKLPLAMDVVSDMLLYSKMDAEEIEREKGVIIEELNMYEDNPMMSIEDVFEDCMYGDTPAGRDTIGTKETINSFRRDDFVKYLKAQYNLNTITVCVAGNIENEEEIEKMIEGYFIKGELAERGKEFYEKEKVVEEQSSPRVKLKYKKTDQAHIALGVRAYGYDHKDKQALKLLSIILGGSMSSRLFINLREKNGLAYYVSTAVETYSDCGYLYTRAGVNVDDVEKAIKIIISEYKRTKDELIDELELIRAKEMLRGRIAIQMEASDSVANWCGRQAVFERTVARTDDSKKVEGVITSDEFMKEIDKVTLEDMKRVAEDVFVNKGLNLAIVGPFKKSEQFSIFNFSD